MREKEKLTRVSIAVIVIVFKIVQQIHRSICNEGIC